MANDRDKIPASDIEEEVLRIREEMGDWTPPSPERWAEVAHAHTLSLRLAWLVLSRPLETNAHAAKDAELMRVTLDGISTTATYFAHLSDLCDVAVWRLMTCIDPDNLNQTSS